MAVITAKGFTCRMSATGGGANRIEANSLAAAHRAAAAELVAANIGQPFHVVFMDLMMPVMNGFEAMRRIRSVDRHVLLVAASASCHPKDMELAMECGADVFLTKPFTLQDVQRVFARFGGPGEQSEVVMHSNPLEAPSTAPATPGRADVEVLSDI